MDLADLAIAALAIAAVAVLAALVRRAERSQGTARTVLVVLVAWLAITTALSVSGVLLRPGRPPLWPALPLSAFLTIFLVMRGAAVKRLVVRVPIFWPIAAQSFRIGVELALAALYRSGRAPRQITFEGRNFDIVVGLSAPLIAWLVVRGGLGSRAIILWNLAGLAILANTVGTIISSTPGPLHHDWPGEPLTAVATWPIVWLPAFLMPLAVFLHVFSIRQSLTSRGDDGRIANSPR